MFVKERFVLDRYVKDTIQAMEPEFGYDGLGEFVFYRTYSRFINGRQETWSDCIIRVIEGIFSIRKDYYLKNYITWDEKFWQEYAAGMLLSAFHMEWMPPGRGLWACGTDFVYERGSMATQNCGYCDLGHDFEEDLGWACDALMLGVGVGFSPHREEYTFPFPSRQTYDLVIADSREGWVHSIVQQMKSLRYGLPRPHHIYDKIREKGLPIKGFGGIASGPEPLKEMHEQIDELFDRYMTDPYYDSVMLKTDLMNLIGVMVVSGNVRRSAELGALSIQDPTFKDLKNYEDERYAYRSSFGWMSNNSAILENDEDFDYIGEIAQRVITRGEPGIINLRNFPYGRIGKKDDVRKDKARGLNPCGESLLENKELCCQAETLPTVCNNPNLWQKACEYATVYASTISLLPTHQPVTNAVIARNRRITVGIIDGSGWKLDIGLNQVVKYLRLGYQKIRDTNNWTNDEAGVSRAIRVSTVKPGGSIPKLPGKTPGIGHPTFRHTLRRITVAKNSPTVPILVEANIPYRDSFTDKYSYIFEWPIIQGPAKPAEEITLWEQAFNLIMYQREWADNAVSNTLYFKPKWVLVQIVTEEKQLKWFLSEHLLDRNDLISASAKLSDYHEEFQIQDLKINVSWNDDGDMIEARVFKFDPHHEEDDIEPVLSHIAPLIKSVSMLPHSPKGVYKDMPEEGITPEEYESRKAAIKKIDWSKLSGSDGQDEKFCGSGTCEIKETSNA